MKCLAQFDVSTWLLVHHDGHLGIIDVHAIVGPGEDWQHTTCGPRTADAGRAAYQATLDAVPEDVVPTSTEVVPTVVTEADPTGADSGSPFALLGGTSGIGIAVILAVIIGYVRMRRRERFSGSPDGGNSSLERWKSRVRGDTYDKRASFSDADKEATLRLCAYRCEWVDLDTGVRCDVLHGVNGMKLQGDHMIPRNRNGQTVAANCSMLCPTHNGKANKGDELMPDAYFEAIFANRKLKNRIMVSVPREKLKRPSKDRTVDVDELFRKAA